MAGKASTAQQQQNEHMILMEVFVERVQLNDNVDPNLRAGLTTLDFQFLDNDPIPLEDLSKKNIAVCVKESVNIGKTCLFSLTPPETAKALDQFDLFIRVFKSKKCGVAKYLLVGVALIPLTTVFRDALKIAGDKNTDSSPGGSRGFSNSFQLSHVESGEIVGTIFVAIKLTCFGKYIQTDFQMNTLQKSIAYKANEAQCRLKYSRKNEPCPELCNQTQMLCPTPKTCGVQFVPRPAPLPPAPVEDLDAQQPKGEKEGKEDKEGKRNGEGANKKGTDKGNAKKKGKGNGTVKVDSPDKNPIEAKLDSTKQELGNKETSEFVPCPPGCYNKELQSTAAWNNCSMRCPNYPDTNTYTASTEVPNYSSRECSAYCPLTGQNQKQPCNVFSPAFPNSYNAAESTALPPQATINCPFPYPMKHENGRAANIKFGTAMNGVGAQPPFNVGETNQQYLCAPSYPGYNVNQPPVETMPTEISYNPPVTMMYASEPNYAPNVPQTNFHVDMGLGGALACRIHEENVPQKIPCPVNYMAPPNINGQCPFPCQNVGQSPQQKFNYPQQLQQPSQSHQQFPMVHENMVPMVSNQQPQIVNMYPGPDPNTPFRFRVGDGAIEGNSLCVNPPTILARDGTRYTEISDPKRECFLLRIGKKFEGTMGGKNNVDIHLTTPPPPPTEVECLHSSQQYKITDCPPGAAYILGPISAMGANPTMGKPNKKGNKGNKK